MVTLEEFFEGYEDVDEDDTVSPPPPEIPDTDDEREPIVFEHLLKENPKC